MVLHIIWYIQGPLHTWAKSHDHVESNNLFLSMTPLGIYKVPEFQSWHYKEMGV